MCASNPLRERESAVGPCSPEQRLLRLSQDSFDGRARLQWDESGYGRWICALSSRVPCVTHMSIGIAVAFGAFVLLLAVLLVVLVRRSQRRADGRVDEVVRTLEFRMDELAQELAGAVDRAEEEGRRSRFLGEIAGSIDLDEVLARTLEAAGKLPGADAGRTTGGGSRSSPSAQARRSRMHAASARHASSPPSTG